MELRFSANAWEDYQVWIATDKKVLRRLNAVIKDVCRSPHDGIGKPEPLKESLSGWWSRRITEEHRLVYRVAGEAPNQTVEIASCRHQDRLTMGLGGPPVSRSPSRKTTLAQPAKLNPGGFPSTQRNAANRAYRPIQPWRAFIRGFFLLIT